MVLALHLPLVGADPAQLPLGCHHTAEMNIGGKTAFNLPAEASSQAKAIDLGKRSKKKKKKKNY